MIIPIVSLIFYIVDPILGVIVALILPYALSLDNTSSTGDYSYTIVGIIFSVVSFFIRKVSFDQESG